MRLCTTSVRTRDLLQPGQYVTALLPDEAAASGSPSPTAGSSEPTDMSTGKENFMADRCCCRCCCCKMR
eukprot:1352569-Amphidinium_carterae.1